MPILFTPLSTETARRYQAGGPDANGQHPEPGLSDGDGNPCRHCLRFIPAGRGMLILSHRPFPAPQPYAETGPIFLCAELCDAPADRAGAPEILASPDYILRGYGADNRIVYGTGAVVPVTRLHEEAEVRLADPRVAYLHLRSARNNCYQLRIDRASAPEQPGTQT
jgi:hypothetical protein